MNKFKYEPHCHSSQSSPCAKADSRDVVKFYAEKGYAGMWFTDHLKVCCKDGMSWQDRIEKLCAGYNEAKETASALGITLFLGWEFTHGPELGTDFLTYGLTAEWLLRHPEIDEMGIREYLGLARESGAFVVHAHPFRGSKYIDMIRLLPDAVDAVETINSNRSDFENERAADYSAAYRLPAFAGTDNHRGKDQPLLCGIALESKALSIDDWCGQIRNGKYECFSERNI